ncbi:hypothetical protein CPC08DRAFT_730965 [Agrocybe pediades]|nr:hypothetical protein CPC08DRAFT_730965 [Agrocybe pediades]
MPQLIERLTQAHERPTRARFPANSSISLNLTDVAMDGSSTVAMHARMGHYTGQGIPAYASGSSESITEHQGELSNRWAQAQISISRTKIDKILPRQNPFGL